MFDKGSCETLMFLHNIEYVSALQLLPKMLLDKGAGEWSQLHNTSHSRKSRSLASCNEMSNSKCTQLHFLRGLFCISRPARESNQQKHYQRHNWVKKSGEECTSSIRQNVSNWLELACLAPLPLLTAQNTKTPAKDTCTCRHAAYTHEAVYVAHASGWACKTLVNKWPMATQELPCFAFECVALVSNRSECVQQLLAKSVATTSSCHRELELAPALTLS